MITSTARKHITRSLRDALRLNMRDAGEILTTIRNENSLCLLGDTDMRTVKALISNGCSDRPTVGLYVDGGQGYEYTGVELSVTAADVARWNALGLDEAYAIAADVHANRGPLMQAADDRMAAEAAAEAMNDNDLLPDEMMDQAFGPIPESRDYQWTNGTVVRADMASSDDHVVVLVDLADGTRKTMAMFPLFSDAADLLSYATGRINQPARLCVGRVNAFDNAVPAGFDRSMPVLDMIVDQSDVPGLVQLYRRAA